MTQRLVQVVPTPEGKIGARFTGLVTPMPGCPDLAVSHAVYRMEGDLGYGKKANLFRQDTLKVMGYSGMICTVDNLNYKQINILSETGWKEGPKFFNPRTGNLVSIWMKGFHHWS